MFITLPYTECVVSEFVNHTFALNCKPVNNIPVDLALSLLLTEELVTGFVCDSCKHYFI